MEPYEVGTHVKYHGSKDYMYGQYVITGHYSMDLRPDLTKEEKDIYYSGGEAYEMWRVGAVQKMGNRDGNYLYSVRRASITVVPPEG